MKLLTLSAILFCAIFFSSCQKKADPPSFQLSKIKTFTEDVTFGTYHSTTTYNLTYDSENRLIKIESANSPEYKLVYSYPQQNIFRMDRFNSNQLLFHEDFYLNNFSLIDSTILYDENNDTTMTEKYVYNSGKQLILQKEYVYQDGSILDNITEFEYGSDGTIVKQSDNYSVITYDYYDLENNLTSFTPFTFQSPKLVKTTTDIRGGVTTIVNHTYTFDNQKRLTSETITQPGTGNTVINSYTY